MNSLWNKLQHDIALALHTGTPPIYLQLLVVTALFILVKLYLLYKEKVRRAKVPPPSYVTNIYLGVVIIVSLGGLETAVNIYQAYIKHILRVYF